ncbi:hypothetical protein [Actinomadura rudentiformis]|uniref:Uncharacterized protein n=1 Tax=Actinomadura rudentiformis TaxID=359158 RepID=A0A6H9YZA3_9ACTN|nr:hypothetical protein [Actinomadura rudentiformis]KAB2350707.1 hypothetical protein F8566_06890 [Actinomadura rudentiformis]
MAETLVMLAASAPLQIAWRERHGWSEDELGLDFDWAASWVVRSVDERAPGLLPDALKDLLRQIDGQLDEMSGPDGSARWSSEGLAEDRPWEEIRQLAARALDEIVKLDLIAMPNPADL